MAKDATDRGDEGEMAGRLFCRCKESDKDRWMECARAAFPDAPAKQVLSMWVRSRLNKSAKAELKR